MHSFKEFLNENTNLKFDHNKYYIVFDWYIQGEINPTAIGNMTFSTKDMAEKQISFWKNELSKRMSGNASRREAASTLSSFEVKDGGQLNDENRYELYDNLD